MDNNMPTAVLPRAARRKVNLRRLALIKDRHQELLRRQQEAFDEELEQFADEEMMVADSHLD